MVVFPAASRPTWMYVRIEKTKLLCNYHQYTFEWASAGAQKGIGEAYAFPSCRRGQKGDEKRRDPWLKVRKRRMRWVWEKVGIVAVCVWIQVPLQTTERACRFKFNIYMTPCHVASLLEYVSWYLILLKHEDTIPMNLNPISKRPAASQYTLHIDRLRHGDKRLAHMLNQASSEHNAWITPYYNSHEIPNYLYRRDRLQKCDDGIWQCK